jgi:hypothetical protein
MKQQRIAILSYPNFRPPPLSDKGFWRVFEAEVACFQHADLINQKIVTKRLLVI